MRFTIKLATLVLSVMLTQTQANALPCDNTRWCAQYSGRSGGATNCGFFTIEQCRATVSGIGGFCVPNQFYNPGPMGRTRSSRHTTRSVVLYPRGDRTSAFKVLVGRARPGTCAKQVFCSFLHASTQSVPGFP